MNYLPLLLPHVVDGARWVAVPQRGFVALLRDRRLMWWERSHRGAREHRRHGHADQHRATVQRGQDGTEGAAGGRGHGGAA